MQPKPKDARYELSVMCAVITAHCLSQEVVSGSGRRCAPAWWGRGAPWAWPSCPLPASWALCSSLHTAASNNQIVYHKTPFTSSTAQLANCRQPRLQLVFLWCRVCCAWVCAWPAWLAGSHTCWSIRPGSAVVFVVPRVHPVA